MLGTILKASKAALPVLKGVGRATGVLGRKEDGKPVTLRSGRLVASLTALLIALFSYFGVPEEIAEPLADVVVELGLEGVDSLK